jgi:hypothetical protein
MAQSPKIHLSTMQLIPKMSSFNARFSMAYYTLPEVPTSLTYQYVQRALDIMEEYGLFVRTHIHDLDLLPEPSIHMTMLVNYLIKHTKHLKSKIISKIYSYPDNNVNFIIHHCS